MSASLFDQFDPRKTFLGPLLAFNKMAAHLYGGVGKEHVKALNNLLLCHAQQMQELSHAKKPEQMMEIQAAWLAKAADPLNDYAQHVIDAMLEGNSQYTHWLEDNFQQSIKEGKNLQESSMGKK